jgi:hypothetical protein
VNSLRGEHNKKIKAVPSPLWIKLCTPLFLLIKAGFNRLFFMGAAKRAEQGGHCLPFCAISCRFIPQTRSVWLWQRVGITFALMGMRSRHFGVLSTN